MRREERVVHAGHIMNVETSYYGVSVAGETRLVGSNSCHAVRASRKVVNRSTFPVPFAKLQHGKSAVRISGN